MDLKPEHLRIVREIFACHLPDREVRVFGSRAVGPAKPYSDLDLVIMGEEPLPLTTMRILRDAFDDSDLPFQVDLLEWMGVSEEFRIVLESTARTLGQLPAVPG